MTVESDFRKYPPNDLRDLSLHDARALPAGASHYRAFVGPPDRFDFMSATQFSLLFANGLREHHSVLDFGCGSLRLGRLLIPYLQEQKYFGIDPNRWLIDDGIANELGQDAIKLKRPSFAYNDTFDCSAFGAKFDFIMAQSVATHCGPDLLARMLASFHDTLQQDGLILLSVIRTATADTLPPDGWRYPQCIVYTDAQLHEFFGNAGLHGVSIPWYHPAAAWYAVAIAPERLPSERERGLLTGAVLHDPDFASSSKA